MVRSAKIIAGRISLARAKALWPSATISVLCPLRSSTSAMRRATWGSSSTTRIMMRSSSLKADAHRLAQVRAARAEKRSDDVPDGVARRRDRRRQRGLPGIDAEGECGRHDERDHVRHRAGMLRRKCHEHQEAPGDEEND